MIIATSIFFVSLIGIVILFSLKYHESKTGSVFFPALHDWADVKAIELKGLLFRSRAEIERLPPIAALVVRHTVHEIALSLAALARLGEEQAHRLADVVSYKHRFERRETRSEFLKKVSEHKNGIQGGVGTVRDEHDVIAG